MVRALSVCGLLVAGSCAFAGGVSGSGIVVLDPSASGALTMSGNAAIEIPARTVYVNSNSTSAVRTNGGVVLDAPMLRVCGGTQFTSASTVTGTVVRGVAPFADPLSGTVFPSSTGMTDLGSRSIASGSTVTLNPGYYSGGISVTGNSSVTFSPGVYVLRGNLKITAGTIVGQSVTFVMLAGEVDIAGCSRLELSPPTEGSLAGMVIAQPSTNTSKLSLSGNAATVVSGSIYAPGATTSLTGTSTLSGEGPKMGDLLVTNRLTVAGTSRVRIGNAAAPAINLPSMPQFD